MLFTERRPIVVVLLGLAIVVVVIVVWLVVRVVGKDEGGERAAGGKTSTTATQDTSIPAVPTKEPDRQAAESLARFFIERIGSYSNQSRYQNIEDVLPLMNASLKTWAENQKKGGGGGSAYRGVTTKALALEMLTWEPKNKAVMRVSTQRQEASDGGADRVYYQDAEVALVYSGDTWLVDAFSWKDARE